MKKVILIPAIRRRRRIIRKICYPRRSNKSETNKFQPLTSSAQAVEKLYECQRNNQQGALKDTC